MNTIPFESNIEQLILSLEQIEALLTVAMYVDIHLLEPRIHFNYFHITTDIIKNARIVCEKLKKPMIM